jgi:hypothetical protein
MTQQGHANGLSDDTGFPASEDSGTLDDKVRAGHAGSVDENVGSNLESGVLADGNGTDNSEQHDYDQQPDSLDNGNGGGNQKNRGGQGSTGGDTKLRDSDSDSDGSVSGQRHELHGVQRSEGSELDAEPSVSSGKAIKNGRNVKNKSVHNEADSDVVRSDVVPLEVSVQHLSKWWPIIRSGVEEVVQKNSPSLIPEDVYSLLRQGRAWLIIAVNADTKKYEGFIILCEELPNSFASEVDLLIWIAYSKIPGTAELLFPKIEAAAKKQGYKRIAFHSHRDGWVRKAKSYGFKLTERVFHKRL